MESVHCPQQKIDEFNARHNGSTPLADELMPQLANRRLVLGDCVLRQFLDDAKPAAIHGQLDAECIENNACQKMR